MLLLTVWTTYSTMANRFECPAEKNCMMEERKSAVGMILVSKRKSFVASAFADLLGDHSRQVNEFNLPLDYETDGNSLK